jgi:uncharacterized protein
MSKLQGISPRLPLVYSQTDGPYQLNKTLRQALQQNLRMLILTMPGERIMIPDFGVGLQGFLFEQINNQTYSSIAKKITEQVDFYIPSINIQEISFFTTDDDPTLQNNELRIRLQYDILPFSESDQLIITSTMTN